MTDEQLSKTMLEYLVYIYRLSDETTKASYVSTSDLADMLAVSAPAVNRMVTKLREMGLLHHERYQGISLTDAGKREALKQLRRHRITENFLVEVMGFGWHEVHQEAERISNTIGDKLLDRMVEMMDTPTRCPHGNPIPDAAGNYTPPDDKPITEVEINKTYQISRVMTREPERLEYLAALGLKPDQQFKLIHAAPFNGPMQLQLGREYRIIGYNLAEMIRVRPVDTP